MIGFQHWIGIIGTLALVTIVGILSVLKIRNSDDFVVGGRQMGPWLVAAALVGGYIGGTSTIGTAQMAFQQGMSAIWFTLGGGLGSLFTGLVLARRLREAEVITIPELMEQYYGKAFRPWASIYVSFGYFIQVLAQILAFVPIFLSFVPIAPFWAATLATLLILSYMVFGGFWGTSLVGMMKLVLLYVFLSLAGIVAVFKLGGIGGFYGAFAFDPWLNPFSGGVIGKLALGFSTVVGFVSTQSYLQAIFSGRDIKAAKWGAYIGSVLISLIGFMCVIVGMYMRSKYPEILPSTALPAFVLKELPPLVGGIIIATLLISVLITGASLAMGIATILARDIFEKFIPERLLPHDNLVLVRTSVIIVMGIAYGLAIYNLDTLILKWAYLSMTLRGVTVFVPLLAGLFWQQKFRGSSAGWAIIVAPPVAILWNFYGSPAVHPLYIGLTVSGSILIAAWLRRKRCAASTNS